MTGTDHPAFVRRLTQDDWRLLRSTRIAALAQAPEAFGSTLERELAFSDAIWQTRCHDGAQFVAESAGVVRGMASAFHEDGAPATEQHLVGMWVAPEHRGRGIAALLVRAVADWAADQAGATRLTLCVADGNDAGSRLYKRLGFMPTGTVEPLPSDPARTQVRMSRLLPWQRDAQADAVIRST